MSNITYSSDLLHCHVSHSGWQNYISSLLPTAASRVWISSWLLQHHHLVQVEEGWCDTAGGRPVWESKSGGILGMQMWYAEGTIIYMYMYALAESVANCTIKNEQMCSQGSTVISVACSVACLCSPWPCLFSLLLHVYSHFCCMFMLTFVACLCSLLLHVYAFPHMTLNRQCACAHCRDILSCTLATEWLHTWQLRNVKTHTILA